MSEPSPSKEEEKPTEELSEIAVLKSIIAKQGQEIDELRNTLNQVVTQFNELIKALKPSGNQSSTQVDPLTTLLFRALGSEKPSIWERITLALMQNMVLQQTLINRALAKKLGVEVVDTIFSAIEKTALGEEEK